MLTNSLLAGALGAAYLTVLVLQLNPHVPLLSATAWRWFVTLGMLYGLHLAVIFYLVMVAREFFALDGLSPGWASVRVLAWLAAVSAGIAAALMWLNVDGFSAALTEAAARRMTRGAIATSGSAIVLLGIAIAHYSFGRRGSRAAAAVFVVVALASIGLPLAARGKAVTRDLTPADISSDPGRATEPGPRVVMLLLDGASLEYVWPRVAEGRLPNFARLLEKGAWMDLATIRPTQPDPVWAAVATGMYPSHNGVRSSASYYVRNDDRPIDLLPDHVFSHVLVHLGFVRGEASSASAWRARPLWAILGDAGLGVGVVRWPLTFPAPEVPGFVVSDRFHQLGGSIAAFDRAAYPPDILPQVQEIFGAFQSQAATREGSTDPEASALARDRSYSLAMQQLRATMDPRFAALRYEGLDTVAHYYLRYSRPTRTFGTVTEEDRQRYGQAVDRYYAFIDAEIGATLDTLAPGDLLVVVSGFGMQPLNPLKEVVGRLMGDPDFTGTHERAPDGFLLVTGAAVDPGRHQRGSIVDVAPTILYFLGLPIARDMDGYARADLFTKAFTAERPIAFIPTYGR